MKKHGYLVLGISALLACSCVTDSKQNDQPVEVLKDFTELDFSGTQNFTYDGERHMVEVTGEELDGATIRYEVDGETFKGARAAGTYVVKATVTKDGYNEWTGEKTLVIGKASMDVKFNDVVVREDGTKKTIVPTNLPANAKVEYIGEHRFSAEGSYEVKVKVTAPNYEDFNGTAKLTIFNESTSSLVVDDFENIESADLTENWKLEYYNNGWVVPSSASIAIAPNQADGRGSQTMRMNLSHQGQAFKVTKEIEFDGLPKTISGISLDTMADVVQPGSSVKGQVQVWFKDLPLPAEYKGYANTYMTYTLGKNNAIDSTWTHHEIPFSDPDWKMASGAIEYADALNLMNISGKELSLFIDKVAVLMTPTYVSGGPKAYAYIDNVKLANITAKSTSQVVNFAGRSWMALANDGTYLRLNAANDGTFSVKTINLKDNFEIKGYYATSGTTMNVTLYSEGYSSSFVFTASENGRVLSLKEGSNFNFIVPNREVTDLTFAQPAEEFIVVDNFESYSATGVGHDQSHTAAQMSGLRGAYHSDYNASGSKPSLIGDSQWQFMGSTDYLYLETTNPHSGTRAANFKTGSNQMRYMTYGLASGKAQPLGRAQKLSFFVRGSVNTTIKVKAYYVNKVSTSNQLAETGDAACLANIPVTTGWTQVTMDLDPKREVYGIAIIPTKTTSTQRIYIDDLEMINSLNPWEPYVDPASFKTIEDGKFYMYNSDADAYFAEISGDVSAITIKGSGDGMSMSGTVSMEKGKLTITTAALSATATILDGNTFKITEVSGPASSILSGSFVNKTFKPYEPVNLSFSDGTVDANYTNSNWSEEVYKSSGWASASGNIRSKTDVNNNKVINMYCDTSARNYYYTPEKSMGPVNNLSLRIGNYFTNKEIKIKISIFDASNTKKYIVGDANTWQTLPYSGSSTKILNAVEFDFGTVAGAKLCITTQVASGNSYLYIDDVALTLK